MCVTPFLSILSLTMCLHVFSILALKTICVYTFRSILTLKQYVLIRVQCFHAKPKDLIGFQYRHKNQC